MLVKISTQNYFLDTETSGTIYLTNNDNPDFINNLASEINLGVVKNYDNVSIAMP